jgi:hypothetical protein
MPSSRTSPRGRDPGAAVERSRGSGPGAGAPDLSEEDRARVRELVTGSASGVAIAADAGRGPEGDDAAGGETISPSPLEVPRRATWVKVAWPSGKVTEIEVPMPHRRELFRTPPAAAECQRSVKTPHLWSLKFSPPSRLGEGRSDERGDVCKLERRERRHWPRAHTTRGGAHGPRGLLGGRCIGCSTSSGG